MSFNQVTLIGRLGKDPEIRHTQGGKAIANFSLATSETWRNKDGEKQEKTEWHTVVVFNEGLAGVVERFLVKGSQVMVQGQLRTRKWVDKEGNDRYSTEVVLDTFNGVIRLLGGKPEGSGEKAEAKQTTSQKAQAQRSKPKQEEEYLDDEVPF